MANRMKAQGTKHESWLVNKLKDAGHWARRLAEGGKYDEGDVEAIINGSRWVLEAKARATINPQKVLASTRRKAQAVAGQPLPVAVVWKRLVKLPGYKTRQPVDGERVVVIMSWDDFLELTMQGGEGS